MIETTVTRTLAADDPVWRPRASLSEEVGATFGYARQFTSPYQVAASQSSGAELMSAAAGLNSGVELPEDYYQPPRLLSEDEWKESRYRDMPYEPGITEERAQSLRDMKQARDYYEDVVSRSPGGLGRNALRMGTFIGTQIFDPLNFVPFVGWTGKAVNIARGARGLSNINRLDNLTVAAGQGYRRAAAIGAADATIGNAVVDAVAFPNMNASGDDLGWRDVALDAVLGAGIGGVFGATVNFFARRNRARAGNGANNDATIQAAELHDRNIKASIAEIVEGNPVGNKASMAQLQRESRELGNGYDRVLDDPLGGSADEVMAVISSPEFERILVERGPSILNENGSLTVSGKQIAQLTGGVGRGWGLVKIIWRHGEKSKVNDTFKVSRDDVVSVPQLIREYSPVEGAARRSGTTESRWVIPRENEPSLVIAVRRLKGRNEQSIITVFKTDKAMYGVSEKRKGSVGLPGEGPAMRQTPPEDTAGASLSQGTRSQEAYDSSIGSESRAVKQENTISPSESSAGGLKPQTEIPPGRLSMQTQATDSVVASRTAGGQIDDALNITRAGGEVDASRAKPLDEIDFDVPANVEPDLTPMLHEADPAANFDADRIERAMRTVDEMEARGELSEDESAMVRETRQQAAEDMQNALGLRDMFNCIMGRE